VRDDLGSHVLESLLKDKEVQRIYTLDRGAEPLNRLTASFKDRGLSLDLLQDSRLSCLVGDLTQMDLGLDPYVLEEISVSTTHIIHNAWKLDFNLSLSSFESHIAGTRTLIDFCDSCVNPVKFLFSSSISAAQLWNVSSGAVPEEILSNPEVAVGTGYGSSKYVTERLLGQANNKGLETMSLRIGQISGSTRTGAWNATDWVPIIIKSSIALGCLPDLPGDVAWIPVDVTSRTIVDSVLSSNPLPEVVNLVHPRPVPWRDVFMAANDALGGELELLPFEDWFRKLEARSANANEHDLHDVPAIKLLRFFRRVGDASNAVSSSAYLEGSVDAGGQPHFNNDKAQEISKTLRDAKPTSAADVKLWIDSWNAGPWKALSTASS